MNRDNARSQAKATSKPVRGATKPSLPPGKATPAASPPKPKPATVKPAVKTAKPTTDVAKPTAATAKLALAASRPKVGGNPMSSYLRRQVSDDDDVDDGGSGWDTDDAETPAPKKVNAPAPRKAVAPVATTAAAAPPMPPAAAAEKPMASRNSIGALLKRPGAYPSDSENDDESGWDSDDDGANGVSLTDPVPERPAESHPVASRDMASDDAAATSKAHKRWIVETLKEQGGSCSYELIVEVGETKHCDTVGAMLKFLKNGKVIKFNQIFLMYPMHKDEIVTLIDEHYNP